MHGEGKKMKGSRGKGRGGLGNMFEFYALLATGFSLCYWRVRRRGGWRYVRTSVTVLTALTIHLLRSKNISVAFYRVLQCAFLPGRFLC